jgi:hypothetical protein
MRINRRLAPLAAPSEQTCRRKLTAAPHHLAVGGQVETRPHCRSLSQPSRCSESSTCLRKFTYTAPSRSRLGTVPEVRLIFQRWGGRPRPRRTPGSALPSTRKGKPTRASAAVQGDRPGDRPTSGLVQRTSGRDTRSRIAPNPCSWISAYVPAPLFDRAGSNVQGSP